MNYTFGKQDALAEHSFLLTNGLGGYVSLDADYAVSRCDQGLLVAAVRSPNVRITLVHRMRERLKLGQKEIALSSQRFAGRKEQEPGGMALSLFSYDAVPTWTYEAWGLTVQRTVAMAWEKNAVAVRYEICNRSSQDCTLALEPFLKFAPKEEALTGKKRFAMKDGRISDGQYQLHIQTNGSLEKQAALWETLAYPEDAKDGRPEKGMAGCCCRILAQIPAGTEKTVDVVFSLEEESFDAGRLIEEAVARKRRIASAFRDPMAGTLAAAADAFIVRRDSTGGKTILAGYPLFSDWGRDTMIALPGCCLSTGRYEDARSILRTFLAYEQDGLVPNLFPEGQSAPMYNTVDAALLLIDCVWQYAQRTGDLDFVREAWPVMERIVACYRRGTHHSISMDEDGLIRAGGGLDQVTWMDVCVNGILPTPRHGKPVEVNAYWYNALRVMDALAQRLGLDGKDYGPLARQVKESFREKFWMPEKGCLKDVLSGTGADEQIRCNQIWAVSMAFGMLDPQQEKQVVDTVTAHLYTPCGLRSLSPEDGEFRGSYGGSQLERDLAYHQGTVWVFPLGAYYRAMLKVYGAAGAETVRRRLGALEPMLRQGCLGQLPEIYSGLNPGEGKGCFAQAWSVGELLRVLEELEIMEQN